MINNIIKKSIVLFFILLFSISEYSCNKDNESNFLNNKSYDNVPFTRTQLPASDCQHPDQISGWDWTAYGPNDLVDIYFKDRNLIKQHRQVQMPWYSPESPAYWDFGEDIEKLDISPDDGWELLAKDFGCDARADSQLPLSPFFALYNRARGLIRLFYFFYNEGSGIPYSIGKVSLEYSDGNSAHLSFENNEYSTLEDYNDQEDYSNQSITVITKLQDTNWNYADFVVAGYDPYLQSDANFKFTMNAVEVNEGEFTFNGSLSLTGKLDFGSVRSFGLSSLISDGMQAWSYYKNSQKAVNFLVKQGLLISEYSTVIGAAAGLAGFVKSISSYGKKERMVPIVLEGDIIGGGDLRFENIQPISNITVAVPGTQRTANDSAMYDSIYQNKLGIYSLNIKPRIAGSSINGISCGCISCSTKIVRFAVEIGLDEPITYLKNQINGYKVTNVEASFVWNKTDENGDLFIKRDPNWLPIDEFNSYYSYLSGNRINVNEVIKGDVDFGTSCYRPPHYFETVSSNCTSTSCDVEIEPFMKYFPSIAVRVTVEKYPAVDGDETFCEEHQVMDDCSNKIIFIKNYEPVYGNPTKYATPCDIPGTQINCCNASCSQ